MNSSAVSRAHVHRVLLPHGFEARTHRFTKFRGSLSRRQHRKLRQEKAQQNSCSFKVFFLCYTMIFDLSLALWRLGLLKGACRAPNPIIA